MTAAIAAIATTSTAPQLLALVDVEDLEDGDLAAVLGEIGMRTAAGPRRVPASPAARQAEVDAVVAAWKVARDRRPAAHAHHLGARAAALVV